MRVFQLPQTVMASSISLFLLGEPAMSYESIYPRTPVGTIEIKTLPARTTLVAAAPGDAFKDRGASFMKLFNYIKDHKVAMSIPVAASASTNEMVFFVGSDRANQTLTSTEEVRVQTLPAMTVASIGLRGGYSRANYKEGLKRLRAWLDGQREWRANGEPYVVYWNSPFVPWFLRKSEIHVPVERGTAAVPTFYTFDVETIDGAVTNLMPYRGQVVLVVNVASRCGFTKQYAALQKLYEAYRARGLVVLGFPSNDFLGQEPGTNEEIKQFCSVNFGVTFPMFAKIRVKGKSAHPLYAWLTDKTLHPNTADVSWNFNKFLIGRDGNFLAYFGSRTTPDDPDLIAAIEKALQP